MKIYYINYNMHLRIYNYYVQENFFFTNTISTNYTITLHKALPLPMKIHKNCTHVYNIYHTHSSTKTHYLQFLIRWDLGLEKLLALVFSGNFLLSVPFPGVPHPLKSRTRCSVCVFTKQIYIYIYIYIINVRNWK